MGKECQLKANEDYKKLGRPLPYPYLEIKEIEEPIVEVDNSIEEI